MKKTLKKALAIILAAIMLATAAPAAFAATVVASGTAGDNVQWSLDSDGKLSITGSGEIKVGWYEPPWKAYNAQILTCVIGEGITLLPSTALSFAENMTSLSLPSTLITYQTYATPIWGCEALEQINVHEDNKTFKSIDGILFTEDEKTIVAYPAAKAADEYTVPASVATIAENAFRKADIGHIIVPDTVTVLEDSCFCDADVTSVTIGSGVTEIPVNALSDSTVESFVVPDTVKTIKRSAFRACYDLTSIVIGSGVETIEGTAFEYTNDLAIIHYNGTQDEWNEISIDTNNGSYNGLLTKEIHFVSHKEATEPTCVNGNTAGLYCSECEKYVSGKAIAPVDDHNFNGDNVCDVCELVCYHESGGSYIQTAAEHQFECIVCKTIEEKEKHDIDYYESNGDKCAPYCSTCGLIEVLEKPHSMTDYSIYDDKNCIKTCVYCGYGDEETGLVSHSMTDYDIYDNEYCIVVCENCEYGDPEEGLVKHSFNGGVVVPATEKEAEHIKYTCENCKYFYKEYKTKNAITLKLYSEYEEQWEDSAIIAYVNGKPVTLIRNMTAEEWDTFALPYDENSSYVFKWINAGYNDEFGVEIYLPDSDDAVFEEIDMSGYDMLQTIYTVNVADYSDVDAALAEIPDYLEYYSADSVAKLVTAVKGVERMLPEGKQADVDAMADAIEAAVDGLVELDDPVPNGVINMSAGNYVYINDSYYSDGSGYAYYNEDTGDEAFYEYEGKYVILETEEKDSGDEDYVHYGIYTYTGKVEFDLVNTFITGYSGNFGIYEDSDVTLNLFGANALACYYTEDEDKAGIEIEEDAKLHIKDSKGSLVAIGQDDQAGIGSEEDEDNGEIVIDGSTIFALSVGDGAGIGGGYEGGAGKITINGGTIYAESMSDDGAGIGVGDDGFGGDIIINGGNITALGLDDDGAGIGGADSGYIDSITINGGNIVAGSEDAAAIGGGQEAVSYGGKITINGGNISAHEYHDRSENLIGNGSSNSKGEDTDNFVQINGGNIDCGNSNGIFPAPRNKDGKKLVAHQNTVHKYYGDKEITLELSDGSDMTVAADGTDVLVYVLEGTTIENSNKFFVEHMNWFRKIFLDILYFFSSIFS